MIDTTDAGPASDSQLELRLLGLEALIAGLTESIAIAQQSHEALLKRYFILAGRLDKLEQHINRQAKPDGPEQQFDRQAGPDGRD